MGMTEDEMVTTPTECLVGALEDFGADEAKFVMVVYITHSGDIAWKTSRPLSFSQAVGMLECARASLLRAYLRED